MIFCAEPGCTMLVGAEGEFCVLHRPADVPPPRDTERSPPPVDPVLHDSSIGLDLILHEEW